MNRKAFGYIRSLFANMFFCKPKYPLILSYLITNKCNSHCVTCNVWRETQNVSISLNDLQKALQDKLFCKIKHVGISGGEPSTFACLNAHIEVLISQLPFLETISITTNCINSNFWIQNAELINAVCLNHGIYFQLNISLDGIESMHDKIRGSIGNFVSFEKVIKFLAEKNIPYQIHTTIDKYNVYHINAILHYAQLKKADVIFRLASEINRLDNKELIKKVALTKKQISFLCDFLVSKRLMDYTKSPGRRLYYKSLRRQLLSDGKRIAPCYFKDQGIVLLSDGKISHCSRFEHSFTDIYCKNDSVCRFRDKNLNEACSTDICSECYHDQTGFWHPFKVISELFVEKIALLDKLRFLISYLFCAFTSIQQKRVEQDVESIAVVGMYGGEHVGDAAILGGVVSRMKKCYPALKKVVVFSFRKDRTECWINNLTELQDINFQVFDNDKLFIQQFKDCQLLLWAGGPMMEIPVLMGRNYYFIRKAQATGCRIEIEGIGYGPINSIFGTFMSKCILQSADHITVRSKEDAHSLLNICNINKLEGFQDPAFDYLALIPENPNLSLNGRSYIDKIIEEHGNQKVLALNIRPLWNRYGKSDIFDFDIFLHELTATLQYFISQDYLIVFFPMNADQFGFSDLDVAYEIQERLGKKSLFKILETEPTINELIYLLRKVDVSICMRFHAAIFSLSQGVKTIGIDYSLKDKGKITNLFKNRGDKSFLSIKEFKSDAVINLLNNI